MERCSSSTSYMDYHRHSMASNNFCYPYSPGMMRNGGSPYPMGVGPGAPRYGMTDYRSGGYYGEGGFEKYYGASGGGYHSGYGANYYGNGYASYRDFGYNDYYQGSAFAGHHGGGYHGPPGSSHLYSGRQSLPLAFQRESYYHHPRDHPHSSPYGFGGNYSGNPYKADSSVGSSTTPNSINSGDAALFGGTPNGNSFQHSPDYPYGSSGDSPGGPEGSGSRSSGGGPGYPTSPSSSAMPNATGFPLSIKDARMRKLKERKLAKSSSSYSPGGGGGGSSTCSSPNPLGSNGAAGNGSGNNPGATNGPGQRLKSLDALGSDTFEHHERPGKSSPSSRHPSPGRAVAGSGGGSPPKRSKKQTSAKHGRGSSAAAASAADNDKPGDPAAATTTMATPDKNVTPLPGFQQAFGSTEIGKFSEAFFNSSPGPAASDMLGHQHPDGASHHNTHHHHHHHHHPHPHHQLMMTGCESDVDTLSPQPWEPTGPGDPFHEPGGNSTYNLQIGTSFHPSYYETASSAPAAYTTTDHAVDSPLGNYFSEMSCTDQYVT